MRKELFYNPRLLLERVAQFSIEKRRFSKLKNTAAEKLNDSQITSIEFLELARKKTEIKIMYDLGANVGSWSILADVLIPNTIIHAFEPIPVYQEDYLKNTKLLKNTTLHKVGVGSENKKAQFNFAGHSSSFLEVSENLLKMFPNEKKTGEVEVNMVKLDDYVQNNKLPLPDLMKLDVEGYELEVLKNGTRCLNNCKFVILEVSFIERHIGQPLFNEVVSFMGTQNYELCAFPFGLPIGQEVFMADVMFKNKRLV